MIRPFVSKKCPEVADDIAIMMDFENDPLGLYPRVGAEYGLCPFCGSDLAHGTQGVDARCTRFNGLEYFELDACLRIPKYIIFPPLQATVIHDWLKLKMSVFWNLASTMAAVNSHDDIIVRVEEVQKPDIGHITESFWDPGSICTHAKCEVTIASFHEITRISTDPHAPAQRLYFDIDSPRETWAIWMDAPLKTILSKYTGSSVPMATSNPCSSCYVIRLH